MTKRIVRDRTEEEIARQRRNDYLFTCPKCGQKDTTEYIRTREWTRFVGVGMARTRHKALVYECNCGVTYEVDIHPLTGAILDWEDSDEASH